MAERESRAVAWIAGGLVALLVAFGLARKVENPLEPEPLAAYVALLPEGEPVASDGPHELAAGRGFRLFAVLEAKDWRGRTVYFSEAPALRLGGREIDAAAIRRWDGGRIARVRWFTLDAFAPYLEVAGAEDLARFRLIETFRPEWGDGWSAPGAVDPKVVPLDPALALRPLGFGFERYAVRVELFDGAEALTPAERAASPAVDAAAKGEPGLTRVRSALAPPLAALSLAFGRTEIALAADAPPPLAAAVDELVARQLVFVEPRLLAEHLAESGAAAAELVWREIDLAAAQPAWTGGLGAGDLVQAGARVAVLFRDQGEAGRLDPADLAVDLGKGLSIRRLDQIFRGEAGLALEAAALPRRAAGL